MSTTMNATELPSVEDTQLMIRKPRPHDVVCRLAKQRLQSQCYRELAKVYVDATEDVLILTGTVADYYLKQRATEAVREVCEDRRILNCIGVRKQ